MSYVQEIVPWINIPKRTMRQETITDKYYGNVPLLKVLQDGNNLLYWIFNH